MDSPVIQTQMYATGTHVWYTLAARVARCLELSLVPHPFMILILILMMTPMVMHCQCSFLLIATHGRRMGMTSLRWRRYG